jgi:hypothetical protein
MNYPKKAIRGFAFFEKGVEKYSIPYWMGKPHADSALGRWSCRVIF